jgi:glycosyltransferase involved in cell wall biosynthesis
VKVLHIVENLNRGAVENWLVRMLRHAHEHGTDLDWTFYCTLPEAGALEEEVAALGARVLRSPVPIGQTGKFFRALRTELRRGGYDVLHCHHDLVSAVYLLASVGISIGRRIIHVHNADENLPTPGAFKQKFLREPLRRICLGMADRIVGISNHTLDTFLSGRARRPGRDIVHYYGIDPSAFRSAEGDRGGFRRALGLGEDAQILLFSGRMVPEKNPLFALDVLAQMRQLDSTVAGVFVGSGSLDRALAARAAELGLGANFRALGWRNDVPAIMCCCDWFILPRPEEPMEGFGIAVVEAQLGGLRLLLSRGIPDDPLLPNASVRRVALNASDAAWAQAAIELLREPAPQRSEALAALQRSPMDMDTALDRLLEIHA